jgi:hypothetical protein
MPTRRTNQLFLKPQPWQSSNQIVFTQARQISQETLEEPAKKQHSTPEDEKNQLKTLDPREQPCKQGPLENPKSENHQAETTSQNPHPTTGTQKAN